MKMLPSAVPGREGLDWKSIAQASSGLVGGEIKNAVILALSEVAGRCAAKRKIDHEDLLRAVEAVRRAKKDVGRYDYSSLPGECMPQSPEGSVGP